MKKIKLPIAIATICSSIVLMTSMMLPASSIRLKLNPKEGNTYKNTIISDIDMNVMGQNMDIHTEMEMQNEITKVSEGTIALNYKMTHFINEMKMPNMPPVSYDSNKENQEGMVAQQLAGIYGLLINKDFPMEINPYGKITKQPDFSSVVPNAAQIGELKETMENLFLDFPEKELTVGDSWTEDKSMEGQVPMNIKTTYTIQDITSKSIVVGMTGAISPADSNTTIDGSTSGTMTLDRKTCWLVSGATNMDMKVSVTVQGQTQSFDMKMTGTIK